jgi:DNA-binding Lrp family transcriptional regulator
LHDWVEGFPLQDAPFQVLARRLGGSVREVLGHCHVLNDAGALDAIRVHWSAGLGRVRWRCGLWTGGRPGPALQAALVSLPGTTQCAWIEPGDDLPAIDGPDLWFDLVARDAAAAKAQLARLESNYGPPLWLPLSAPAEAADCRCEALGGPCADIELARLCEAGLPLRARPYRSLSEATHRSEREVLRTLRRWQGGGLLRDIGLASPPDRHESLWTIAAVADVVPSDERRAALLAWPGVAEVQVLPGHERWPWRLLVAAAGVSPQTNALLLGALAASGLDRRPRRLMREHRMRWRAAPLLFADPEGTPGAAA